VVSRDLWGMDYLDPVVSTDHPDTVVKNALKEVTKEVFVLGQHLDTKVRAALDPIISLESQVDLKKTLDSDKIIKTKRLDLLETDVDPVVDPLELENPAKTMY